MSKKEFRKAMPLLGLDLPKKAVDALFSAWDPDGSGELSLRELNKQLRQLEKVARISDRYQNMMRDLNEALREASTHDALTTARDDATT